MLSRNNVTFFVTIVGLMVPLIFFQNCSEFSLMDSFSYRQGLTKASLDIDSRVLNNLLTSSLIKIWIRPNYQIERKADLILADQWTVMIVCDRDASGDLVKVNSGDGVEETYLGIYNGQIRAGRRNSRSITYDEFVQTALPMGAEKIVISAAFGVDAKSLKLMVNGLIVNAPLTIVSGQPFGFSYTKKTIVFPSPDSDKYEFVVFAGDSLAGAGYLEYDEMNSFSRYLGNENHLSSVLFDPLILETSNSGPRSDESPFFQAAKDVINLRCVNCHYGGGSGSDFTNLTETKAIRLGLVDASGSLEKSKIYYRLRGVVEGPAGAIKNMPDPNSNVILSASEISAIKEWIFNIGISNK